MTPTKWVLYSAEGDPLTGFRQEVDRLFDEFFRGPAPRRTAQWRGPAEGSLPINVDLEESDHEFLFSAEVPGVPKAALDIAITERQVTIRGERKEPEPSAGTTYHCREIPHGPFTRIVDLPAPIVPEKAIAKFEDGLLSLVLPKAESAELRRVKVLIE